MKYFIEEKRVLEGRNIITNLILLCICSIGSFLSIIMVFYMFVLCGIGVYVENPHAWIIFFALGGLFSYPAFMMSAEAHDIICFFIDKHKNRK